jgi:hypothetical protein
LSTAKFDTLSDLAGTYTVPVATVAQGSAKAWVNFNGTGTVAIRASFNVTSITDNGTGDYTVNFTTAMPDANYAATGTTGDTDQTGAAAIAVVFFDSAFPNAGFSASGIRFRTSTESGTARDSTHVCLSIFR